jgi:hypothetical protein
MLKSYLHHTYPCAMTFRCTLALILIAVSFSAFSQSKTTEALEKKYTARVFFFYHNTLRALNQKEDPALDALIQNVEKLKLLLIDKSSQKVDHKAVLADYQADGFESGVTSRMDGRTFDVFLKGDKKTEGVVVVVNDESTYFVLDIVGSIALDQVGKLFSTINDSNDIANALKAFTGEGKKQN